MKTTITIALAAALALAAPLTAQTAEELWQTLVEAEVALTIDGDVERADQLLEATAQLVGRLGDESARERVSERLVELRAMVEEERASAAEPSLDDWLVTRVAGRDRTKIADAGAPASRRLAGMLAERAWATPDLESTAIEILVEVAPGTGVELVETLLARRGQGDANLAARLVAAYVATSRARVGLRDGSMRWGDPRWRDLLVTLLGDAALTRSADAANGIATAVETAIAFLLVDEPLADAIAGALERMPEQRAQLIGRRVADTPDVMATVDEALLESGTPDDAAFAAERLARRDDSTPLAEYDEHPDARVRREVARSLTTRRINNSVTLIPPYTKRQREALVRLTADDDVTTRALATRGATSAPDALTRERWLELARNPALDVRIEVAEFPFGHAWTRDVLVTMIDASGEPAVASSLDARLRAFRFVAPLDVIDARLNHPSQPVSAVTPDAVDRLHEGLRHDPEAFVAWYLDGGDERARRYAVMASELGSRLDASTTNDVFAAFQKAVWQATDGARSALPLEYLTDVAIALALDSSLPWDRRWQAMIAIQDGISPTTTAGYAFVNRRRKSTSSESSELATAILSDVTSADHAPPGGSKIVDSLLHRGEHNALTLDMWENDGFPSHPFLAANLSVDEKAPRAIELAERILALGETAPLGGRLDAILALVHNGAMRDELVDDALLGPWYTTDIEPVIDWVARQPDPGRFASVRALLTGEAEVFGSETHERAHSLVANLGGAGTRAALELLLTAAESGPWLSLREMALTRARSVRQHLDAVERFSAEGASPSTPDSARTELVLLLDKGSPAQRAEAARGLATLGAVEELPRLIRLLDDEHAEVRAAVREALDRLHATSDA